MTDLLLRLFVKEHQNINVPTVRSAVGKLAGAVGIFCNCLLFLGKLLVGVISGSVSIVADALNNLSDASSSVVTLLGFRMAQKPADKEHPYGHARYEYLSGLVVAALILVIGFELVKTSVEKVLHPVSIEFTIVTFCVLLASIAMKAWMMLFNGSLGRRIDSTTLKATAADSRNDVITSSAVLVGCAVEHFTGLRVDGWLGLLVALFILWSGVSIAKETVSPLLGKEADKELVNRLNELVNRHWMILGSHDLLVHDYGPGQCFATVHVEMDAKEDPLFCHDVIDEIECAALEKLNVHLVIHYDPVVTDDAEWNEMRNIVGAIVAEIDPALSVHDFRIVRTASLPKLVFDVAVPYAMRNQHEALAEHIRKSLLIRKKDYIVVIRFDHVE